MLIEEGIPSSRLWIFGSPPRRYLSTDDNDTARSRSITVNYSSQILCGQDDARMSLARVVSSGH
ncbi:uncharacterized protein MYCGRDRAFT_103672 [Zymoseptoria tritici IPO323]|uniref:Uncharacterized protein n=1 Tax=Zymoseptoria tritici (strain CBS 115943 / IPO323) TaxID=336722 RepID=F9X6U3_ZYMTI|nr:uncharacterized protein MYCGRDRAFT_103672 [Zymoseptoria tritici IPO323]EGP89454.1 hypothetical protein MYCGRDRAFT_103672 [Zymoseptoria tritici IPO323]